MMRVAHVVETHDDEAVIVVHQRVAGRRAVLVDVGAGDVALEVPELNGCSADARRPHRSLRRFDRVRHRARLVLEEADVHHVLEQPDTPRRRRVVRRVVVVRRAQKDVVVGDLAAVLLQDLRRAPREHVLRQIVVVLHERDRERAGALQDDRAHAEPAGDPVARRLLEVLEVGVPLAVEVGALVARVLAGPRADVPGGVGDADPCEQPVPGLGARRGAGDTAGREGDGDQRVDDAAHAACFRRAARASLPTAGPASPRRPRQRSSTRARARS